MSRTVAALGLAAVLAALLVSGSKGAPEPKSELRPDFRRAHCGSAFEIDALQGPIGAERGREPWAVALRRLFETKPQYIFGERGPWRLLARSERDVLFASRDLPRIGTAELHKSRSGRWGYDGSSSGCVPVVVRHGIEASEWRLDPAFPPPQPSDDTLNVLVSEQGCASGDSATGRVLEPTVLARPRALTVTLFVRPRRGAQSCVGHPPTPVAIDLGQALGNRRLFDGQKVLRKQRYPALR